MTNEKELFPVVDQLLKDAGVPNAGDITVELRRKLAEQLKVIGEAATSEADAGGPKVLLPDGSHLRLGGTVWPLLTCTVTFALAPMDPSGITYGAAGAALMKAFTDLGKVFHTLDPAQRVICRAVLEVAREKKARAKTPEASVEELRSHFQNKGEQIPVKLEDNLGKLVKAEVLREANYPDTGSYYVVTF
jgi:hypothetical protein